MEPSLCKCQQDTVLQPALCKRLQVSGDAVDDAAACSDDEAAEDALDLAMDSRLMGEPASSEFSFDNSATELLMSKVGRYLGCQGVKT